MALLLALAGGAPLAVAGDWFERFKAEATDGALHRFLYAMPKGGDLHLHLTGSAFPEWLHEIALAEAARGVAYYVKTRIGNCAVDAAEADAYLMLYRVLDQRRLDTLSDCERGEYQALSDLDAKARTAWMNSVRLDAPHEGRDEFFERHWQRLGDLLRNPHVVAEILYRNMQAFADEGVAYIEPQVPVFGFLDRAGAPLAPEAVLAIYRQRMAEADAQATGVVVRMQLSALRFRPNAEQVVRRIYRLAAEHADVVAVNLVGREDHDRGHPLRFLDTFRDLRRTHPGVRLSIHAGESARPDGHVRDTLLLGAERIGHGLNLIQDAGTLLGLRHGPYLVETNLISNLLLGYVDSFAAHPFPEYLRTGVPVALSTDDRGMWDSTLTDEFFVAVREYGLSWAELRALGRNSLAFSFLDDATKSRLLREYERRMDQFAERFQRRGAASLDAVQPLRRGFICRHYGLCNGNSDRADAGHGNG